MNTKPSARSTLRWNPAWVALASVVLAGCTGLRSEEAAFDDIPFSAETRIGVTYANGWDADLFPEIKDLVRRMKLANAGAEEAYGVLSDSLNVTVIQISEPERRVFPDGAALESPALTAAKKNLDAVVEFQVKPVLLSDSRPGQQGYKRLRISTWLTLYNRNGDAAWRSTRAINFPTSMYWSRDFVPTLSEQRDNIDSFAEPMTVELLEALPIAARMR